MSRKLICMIKSLVTREPNPLTYVWLEICHLINKSHFSLIFFCWNFCCSRERWVMIIISKHLSFTIVYWCFTSRVKWCFKNRKTTGEAEKDKMRSGHKFVSLKVCHNFFYISLNWMRFKWICKKINFSIKLDAPWTVKCSLMKKAIKEERRKNILDRQQCKSYVWIMIIMMMTTRKIWKFVYIISTHLYVCMYTHREKSDEASEFS